MNGLRQSSSKIGPVSASAAATLSQPDRISSFTHETHVEFGGIMIEREYKDAKAVVLTGIGEASSADDDLSEMREPEKRNVARVMDGATPSARDVVGQAADHLGSGW